MEALFSHALLMLTCCHLAVPSSWHFGCCCKQARLLALLVAHIFINIIKLRFVIYWDLWEIYEHLAARLGKTLLNRRRPAGGRLFAMSPLRPSWEGWAGVEVFQVVGINFPAVRMWASLWGLKFNEFGVLPVRNIGWSFFSYPGGVRREENYGYNLMREAWLKILKKEIVDYWKVL